MPFPLANLFVLLLTLLASPFNLQSNPQLATILFPYRIIQPYTTSTTTAVKPLTTTTTIKPITTVTNLPFRSLSPAVKPPAVVPATASEAACFDFDQSGLVELNDLNCVLDAYACNGELNPDCTACGIPLTTYDICPNPPSITYPLVDLSELNAVLEAYNHSLQYGNCQQFCAGSPATGVSINGPYTIQRGQALTLTGIFYGQTPATYEWDYGDCTVERGTATTTTVTGSHYYGQAGTYTARLIVTLPDTTKLETTTPVTVTDNPTAPLTAAFSVYELLDVDPPAEYKDWRHNGIACAQPDQQGEVGKLWRQINLNSEPLELGLRVRFDPSASTGNINYFSWFFFDGTSASQNPDQSRNPGTIKAYQTAGDYNVRLKVYGVGGGSHTINVPISVDTHLEVSGFLDGGGSMNAAMAVRDDVVWLARASGEIVTLDVSDPNNPQLLGERRISAPGVGIYDMAISDQIVAVAQGPWGVYLIDRLDPVGLGLAEFLPYTHIATEAEGVLIVGDYLYVTSTTELNFFDLRENPPPGATAPDPVLTVEDFGYLYISRLMLSGNLLFVSTVNPRGVHIFNAADPRNPERIGFAETRKDVWDMRVRGSFLAVVEKFTSYDDGDLSLFDISNPEEPALAWVLNEARGDRRDYRSVDFFEFNRLYASASGLVKVEFLEVNDPSVYSRLDLPGSFAADVRTVGNAVAYVALGPNGLFSTVAPR